MNATGYAISPANFHDWGYERESARDLEIKREVKERIDELMLSSGHGKAEQDVMEQALSRLAESEIGYGTLKRYMFELWSLRGAKTFGDRRRKARAAQVIGNLLGPIVHDLVTHEVAKEFGA